MCSVASALKLNPTFFQVSRTFWKNEIVCYDMMLKTKTIANPATIMHLAPNLPYGPQISHKNFTFATTS